MIYLPEPVQALNDILEEMASSPRTISVQLQVRKKRVPKIDDFGCMPLLSPRESLKRLR